MTDQEINSLLARYRETRRPELRDKIVQQYTSLVESVARRFGGVSEPAEDLAQEGYIGLLTAIEGYNEGKGVKFSTYATHFVIGQIKHHLRDRGKIIKEPAWLQELNQRVTRVIESLTQELGRMPTAGEIATLVGMTEEQVADMLSTREVFKVSSLDGSENDDDSGAYDIDRVKADKAVEVTLPIEERLVLEGALTKLKELEQTVVSEFFYKERNQTEIAKSLGISCNYVSHILRNSTKKLRKILASDELREAQTELSLMRKRVEEQKRAFEDSTIVDPITRLYNRRYFTTRLDEEVARGSRHGHPVSMLLVRLEGADGLQRAYGTIRSEDTLRGASHQILENLRRIDIVARYDETTFGIILPHTGTQVEVVEKRLAARLAEWLTESGLNNGRVTIRLRTAKAVFPDQVGTANLLIEAAEAILEPEMDFENVAIAA